MDKENKIYVAGHTGLVGNNLLNKLYEKEYKNILTTKHKDCDLTNENAVNDFFDKNRPEYVFLCAAKVGGIYANNTYPADFITINTKIQTNIIYNSFKYGVKKLLFLGSSCIYPRNCPQPIKEEYLMTGPPEETNSAYALAKICGIEMCKAYNKQHDTNYICAMPPNLIGIGDNFHIENSHVIAALIRKFHEAKMKNNKYVEVWGTGTPKREFLFAEDLADGLVFLMNNYNASYNDNIINIGSNCDVSINDLALMTKKIIGYDGEIVYNNSMPDGTPRKLMDSSKLYNLGWKPKTNLYNGIIKTYEYYLSLI